MIILNCKKGWIRTFSVANLIIKSFELRLKSLFWATFRFTFFKQSILRFTKVFFQIFIEVHLRFQTFRLNFLETLHNWFTYQWITTLILLQETITFCRNPSMYVLFLPIIPSSSRVELNVSMGAIENPQRISLPP